MKKEKQTAVEWFYQRILANDINAVFEQAKELEKEQIIDAYSEGQNTPYEYSEDNEVNWYDGKRYYNENFKSE